MNNRRLARTQVEQLLHHYHPGEFGWMDFESLGGEPPKHYILMQLAFTSQFTTGF